MHAQVDLRPARRLRQRRPGAASPSDPLRHPDADSGRLHGDGSIFGNHRADMQSTGRGGDLYVLYPERHPEEPHRSPAGLRAAPSGFQGATLDRGARAGGALVRHQGGLLAWSSARRPSSTVWRHLLLAALRGDRPRAGRHAGRSPRCRISRPPTTTSARSTRRDGRILFTSDRPRDGAAHLYPQLDEYEEAPIVTGLWSLDPATGDLRAPRSRAVGRLQADVDSFGRVVFTRWDHLQRDQQADATTTMSVARQAADLRHVQLVERARRRRRRSRPGPSVFPEPRAGRNDLLPPHETGTASTTSSPGW